MKATALQTRRADAVRARPFLKWAGGKTQLLEPILTRFPQNFGRYHEPFLGGGAVFFALEPQRGVLSDINGDLIDAYRCLRDDVDGVIAALRKHRPTEAHFYRVRAQNSDSMSEIQSAARTIYLNRTCFNGLYRVNRKGQFNVPYGRYDNPTICNDQNLRLVSEALQGVDINVASAFQVGRRARRGDMVYFDPPYDPVSSSASFTSYAKQPFGRDEQAHLAELFARLANRGVHVMLSNSNTRFIRQLYKGFRIHRVHARRAINSRADRRGTVAEVIITP